MTDTLAPTPVAGSTNWRRAGTALLALLSIELAVLVATGIALYFVYHPTQSQAWGDLYLQSDSELAPDLLRSNRLRLAHRLAGYAAIPTALAAAIVMVVGDRPPRGPRRGVAHAVAIGVIVSLATYTGFLLPWDQLALWAVSVGTDVNGYDILFDDQVGFVLIGGVEVEPETIIGWLVVHVSLGAALVAAVAAA